ncbi:hypothetical protein ACIPY3_16365 [Paenarthrobacter sp. NPDC089714]|uniref:hypothetical protein n=1 Tax=Paenarthrobacter sp. NPDC089714 TaxID=3364377 RepID=UPI00381F8B61
MMAEPDSLLRDDELLHRQVHPNFLKGDGTLMSSAFKPTPKDESKLSTTRDDLLDAAASYAWYQDAVGESAGTWSVSNQEAASAEVEVIVDGGQGELHEAHVSLSFEGKTRSQSERTARQLRDCATTRGRQHPES